MLNGDETFEAEKQGDWYQIKSGPHAGSFVKADFVTVQAPAEASAATTSPATATPSTEASSAAAAAAAATVAPTAAPPEPPPAPPKPWDQNTDDRFNAEVAKAFKKKKNFAESNQIPMPVYYEQFKNPSGTVNTRVIGADEIEADATELFKILRKHVAEKWFEKDEIEKIAPKENAGLQWVPISAFKNSGINVFYDPLKLEIRLLVPPEMRGVETVSLNRENDPWSDETFEKPGLITSFLNINATETFDSRNTTFDDRRTPLQAQLENGTNIANFVVEAYGNYTEDRGDLAGKSSFIRQDVRVTRDIPSFTARASVGDVIYPVQSFQVYRPMKGVAFYRQFSMAPSKLTYPTGDNEIFLKNKSKVYIWVNDQLQKMVELPAGRHQLKDFQYTSGMNNVRFEIIDEFGQTEIQDHSYSASSELLKKGLHQFSYAAGSPSGVDPITGERTYNDANDTFSAFHRYGFNNYFTGGLNGQMDSQQSIFGIEGSFSLKKGFLKLESAYGNTEGIGNGYAVSAYYNYQDYEGPEKTQRSLTVGAKHRSDMFSEFGTTTAPTIAKPLDLSAGYSRGISKTMAINFGLNYILNKKITVEASNGFALRLGLSNRWSNGISGNISAAHTKTNSGKDDISVMGFFIWSFPKERQTLSAYGNSADGSSRIGWNYSPSSGADSASYQANYRQNQSETGYGATALINGNRARMGASHEVVLPKDDEPATPAVESERADNVTTLQVGTSLVFARGRFGIGRPVTDSFAIVAPVKSLKGQTLFVNPDREGNYLAKTDWLGPAVVPELASYNPTTLIVGGKDLPLGISIPQSHFNLYPKFKSGYGFALGVDANVYLVAKLVDARGQALAMESGLATNLDDESAPPITIFTTRRGVMQSEGFRSGRYRIDIAPDKYESIEVVVPENAKEEYDLGTLVMKDKK